MAATVAAPLERQLATISGVNELTSVSSLGNSRITVQFDLSRSIDGAARDVQAALNAALSDLPADMPTLPTFRKFNPSAAPILILALTSDTMLPSAVYDSADTVIAQRLSQVDGVADVTVAGSEQPALRVRVDPTRLAATGISLEDVRAAVVNSNALGPVGAFDGAGRNITIGTDGQLREAADYDPVVVRTRDGIVIRLSNIAKIEPSVRNRLAAGWFNKKPSVILLITKQGDANVIDTIDRIYKLLPELQQWVPAGLKISVLADRTQTIRASVDDMQLTLAASVVLVMLVVFLFLRRVGADRGGRHHGAAGAGRHLRLHVGGRLLHRQSVADGAGRERRLRGRRRHRDDRERFPQSRARAFAFKGRAAGARQIGFTVLSISVSLIAAFIPLLFMGGIVGRFFREFSVTLAFAIAVSTVVSLTVTPMICAYFVRVPPSPDATWLDRMMEGVMLAPGPLLRPQLTTALSTAISRSSSLSPPSRSRSACSSARPKAISRRTIPA